MHMQEVRVGIQLLERFRDVLGEEHLTRGLEVAAGMRTRLAGRVVWNVNSTAVGGGVAEMLRSLLPYTRALGIDTRWLVIQGNPDFFRVTKRLHHALHGSPGDGSPLGDAERGIYEETLRENAVELASIVHRNDFVLLHDPQTAGLAPGLRDSGAHVIWRCHIGHDTPGVEVDAGWAFLQPYLDAIPYYVFSRDAYVAPMCDHGKSQIIHPTIDAFSPKNQPMEAGNVRAILAHTGLIEGAPPKDSDLTFLREDGSPARVERSADVIRLGRAPKRDTPLVVQVSRWDSLKDPSGVMRGFAQLVEQIRPVHAELVLAGPNVKGVTDDPEGAQVLDAVEAEWRELPHAVRKRIHLASLPTTDVEENAAIVNALQRHATVVVQKSLHEGFGLTVTEAMWKARPVLASAVGGIQDQIEPGVSGMLLKDPRDLDEFADALRTLLEDPELRKRLGDAARERVRHEFLGLGHLIRYADLFAEIDAHAS